MKNILVSIAVSLAACVAFHYPEVLCFYLWFGIGLMVGLAAYKINDGYYGMTFTILSIFLWPVSLVILWTESDLLEAMLNIIPGHTLSIKKDEE